MKIYNFIYKYYIHQKTYLINLPSIKTKNLTYLRWHPFNYCEHVWFNTQFVYMNSKIKFNSQMKIKRKRKEDVDIYLCKNLFATKVCL